MAAQIDYTAILGKQVGSAPQPKPLPDGTYTGVISALPTTRTVKTKEGEKGVLSVVFALNGAMDDVDEAALVEAGGLLKSDGEPRTQKMDFWLDENSLWVLDRFMESFGFNAESGKSYAEAFEELPGRDVTVALEQRTQMVSGQERTFVDVKRAFATAA